MYLGGAEKKGRKFLNPIPTGTAGFSKLIPIMRAYAKNDAEVVPLIPPGPFETDPSVYKKQPASGLRVTWMGH